MTRHVTRRLVLLGCGASVAALACGDDGTDSDDSGAGASSGSANGSGSNTSGPSSGPGGPGVGGAGGAVGSCGASLVVMGSNYGPDPHDLIIPLDDVVIGATKTYTTTGIGHGHDVTITDADFIALQNGETVTKYICLPDPKFIDHEFAISCADPSIMPVLQGEIGTPDNCPA